MNLTKKEQEMVLNFVKDVVAYDTMKAYKKPLTDKEFGAFYLRLKVIHD